MSRILEKSFVYTPSFATDLKKRFKKMADAERKRKAEIALAGQHAPKPHIVPIRSSGK